MSSRIFFTGGGTGGHVYPALAVIDQLKQSDIPWDIRWIGSSKGMEKDILSRTDIPYLGIPSGKLRRYFSLQNFLDIFNITAGILKALWILIRYRPRLLFSKGGFVSVPPVIAAWLLRIPVYSHESDLDPGLATKINSRFSRKIFLPYPESRRFFPDSMESRLAVSGNPLRQELFTGDASNLRKAWQVPSGVKVLLVIGGSSGAQQINDLVDSLLPRLSKLPLYIIHQRGAGNAAKGEGQDNYLPLEYIHQEMADLYDLADVIISRAGAGSLWEICALGKASILIPLDSGSRGDQVRNARLFKEKGAVRVLETKEATADNLFKEIETLVENDQSRKALGGAAANSVPRDAALTIAREIEKEILS